jgi:phage terminase Nu1 subunit (DNA packaging protein)
MDPTSPIPAQTAIDHPEEHLWKAGDLARYLGCSVREVRNLRYAGLPTIKFRHLIRFEPDLVKAWLREQQ